MDIDRDALDITLAAARRHLLASRRPGGHWEGELCSSALSTATAVAALALVDHTGSQELITRGLEWLARNANADGGWGDSTLSRSNISTTAICWAAFAIAAGEGTDDHSPAVADGTDEHRPTVADGPDEHRPTVAMAEAWLERAAGGLDPARLAVAIRDRYGTDRTFSVPILATCAIAGKLGHGRDAWRWVEPLPFELAAFPQRWLKWLRLPVVSYALPALVAIGYARFHHRPPLNPITRLARRLARRKAFARLEAMQPASGGFLEATPLTSFVMMNLAAAGLAAHPVVTRGAEFLRQSARDDGSWPIDTNLATWVTTLAANALAASPDTVPALSDDERRPILNWLLGQQHLAEHPFTAAEPGGWAWTDLSGGVPDADDTAGALLALHALAPADPRVLQAASAGVGWLLGLQNRDGGFPTFCRGWGRLPFDRSGADLTAHVLLALDAWLADVAAPLKLRLEAAIHRGIAYLATVQRPDGSWVPLWFGNERAPGEENPVFGTARVVAALSALAQDTFAGADPLRQRGVHWLVAAQNRDGGWGGAPGVTSSIEETALAVDALARQHITTEGNIMDAVATGTQWLKRQTERGRLFPPSPIGFYFARLWYHEQLYPVAFTVAALGRVRSLLT